MGKTHNRKTWQKSVSSQHKFLELILFLYIVDIMHSDGDSDS